MLQSVSPMLAPAIVDIEASGFGKGSYPIEIGMVNERGTGWCSLIKPHADWVHWDLAAAKIHRIERDTLLRHGKPCEAIADRLNQMLRGQVVYSDGWAHDYVWMAHLFEAAGRTPLFRLDDLRVVLTPPQERRWHDVKAQVQAEQTVRRHRASSDAKVLQLTWLRTRAMAINGDTAR